MESYRHTQTGYVILITVGAAILLDVGIMAHLDEVGKLDSATLISMTAAAVILAIALVLFSSLTVIIREDALEIRFGLELIRRTFPLKDIESCQPVKNSWLSGWGIHITPHGWLFNVSGFDAVELKMKRGKTYRIGTDEPDELTSTIREAIAAARRKDRA